MGLTLGECRFKHERNDEQRSGKGDPEGWVVWQGRRGRTMG